MRAANLRGGYVCFRVRFCFDKLNLSTWWSVLKRSNKPVCAHFFVLCDDTATQSHRYMFYFQTQCIKDHISPEPMIALLSFVFPLSFFFSSTKAQEQTWFCKGCVTPLKSLSRFFIGPVLQPGVLLSAGVGHMNVEFSPNEQTSGQWFAPNPCVSSTLSASTSMDTTWWPGIIARPRTRGSPWEKVSVDLRNSWAEPRMTLQSRSVHRKSPTSVRPSVIRILMFLFRSPSSFCRAWDDKDTSDTWVREPK